MAILSKSVLIVDDNAYVRRALRQLFEHETDFVVCGEAQDGEEAIRKAQTLRPELIVMDLSMPVMNGLDAARLIQQSFPKVPIILFSEHAGAFIRQDAQAAGITALVSKEQHASTLIGTARDLIKNAAA